MLTTGSAVDAVPVRAGAVDVCAINDVAVETVVEVTADAVEVVAFVGDVGAAGVGSNVTGDVVAVDVIAVDAGATVAAGAFTSGAATSVAVVVVEVLIVTCCDTISDDQCGSFRCFSSSCWRHEVLTCGQCRCCRTRRRSCFNASQSEAFRT